MQAVPTSMPIISAHRAWHQDGAPKNSMAALEAAARHGVDSVETDIRRLGDGTLVVHHDATRNGVPLSRMTRDMLPTDGTVPTLEHWAKRAGELQVRVLAELKEPGYERQVLDTLRRHVQPDRIDYFSFKQPAVAELAKLAPERPVGLLHDLGGSSRPAASPALVDSVISDARRLGASFIGINHRQSHEPVLAAIHGSGLDLVVWPDTPVPETTADIKRLVNDRRVSTYVTDAPQIAKAARNIGSSIEEVGVKLLRVAATMR